MARQREFDSTQIAGRALAVFGEYGFDRTSMSDLVDATGVLAGSLHAAFGSKEGLFVAGLDLYEQFLFSAVFHTRTTGLSALKHILRKSVRISSKGTRDYRGCPIVTSSGVQRNLSGETVARMAAITRRIKGSFEQHLREGQRTGEIRKDVSAGDVAASLLSTLVGIRSMGIAGAKREELLAMARGVLGTLAVGKNLGHD